MGQHQHTGRVQRILRQLDGSAAGILPHHSGGRAEAICPVGHRDRAGHGSTAGWHVDKAGRGSGSLRCAGKRAARAGKPGGRSCLRHAGAERRERPVDQPGRQPDPQHRGGTDCAAGTPGAGPGLRDRMRQPGVGLQQPGKCDLRLQAGRPHQLVFLSGHCGGQLCGDGGQRRSLYRRGHLHGLCVVLQGKHPAQAVRHKALGFSAHLPALPGCGQECGPQPVRAERDAVLSLAGRCYGVGRQSAHQGVRRAGRRKAFQRAKRRGRRAGWPVLPAHLPGGYPAAGL